MIEKFQEKRKGIPREVKDTTSREEKLYELS